MGMRKLSPGGYEYLTGSVACADRDLEPGESLSDYYLAHGYPPGQWLGSGAADLGLSGEHVTAEQMNALFGEGRHPRADQIETDMIAAGSTPDAAMHATKLGRRFAQYSAVDDLRSRVIEAYKQHNRDHNRPLGAPLDDDTRAQIRRSTQSAAFAEQHGRPPVDDTELTTFLADQKRQLKTACAGYEMVFAPPKSVSTLWALGDQNTRELVVSLHRQAVGDTLTYMENNAAFTRQGSDGEAQVDIRGLTAAVFEHWDSRAGDPHLHSHVPISNKVQRASDGAWTALDGRTIHAAAVTCSEYYNSRVRDLLRDHGASWSQHPANGIDYRRPVWELDGVPSELLYGFSQRAQVVETDRAQRIVAFRQQHGREPSPKELLEQSTLAQYGTREAKQAPQTLSDHLHQWLRQAATMVTSERLATLGQRVFSAGEAAASTVDVAALAARTRQEVSDYHSHFTTWNIESEAHRQTAHLRVPSGTRDQLIRQVVDTVLADRETVALQAPSLVEHTAPELHRRNGESVFVEHNSQRYTTHQTLREESRMASWGQLQDGVRISTSAVDKAIAGTKLNTAQQQAVASFAQSGRRVQLLVAPAGAGKTTMMRSFAQAWRSAGGRVYAFGPSARAAQELGESLKATPHTLHQVTTAQQMGTAEKAFDFRRGDVLIVDEAAMAGTHTLHDVVRYALRRGADVRWVGDDKQLPAVEAGGAVRWFAHRNGALQLHDVVRFADRRQATASLQLRSGNPAGLDYYIEQGWVVGGSRETIRDAAHRAWRTDLDQKHPSLLIVPKNDDVTALNREARELLKQRGIVSDDGRDKQLHDGTRASRGDLIVTRNNDRLKTLFGGRDFVKNGDVWELQRIRRDGGIKVRHHTKGGSIVLPAEYVAQHVELAYAATINRCQGMSVQGDSHSLATQGLAREQFYTAVTRAKHQNKVYVETHQHTIDSHQETPPEQDARTVLEGVLSRSSATTSATEAMRDSLARSESLRTLLGQHHYIARLGAEERIEQVLSAQPQNLLESPATPTLVKTLHHAEDLGWQAEQLIPAVLGRTTTLGAADDPAAMLNRHAQRHVLAHPPPPQTVAASQAAINRWRSIIESYAPTAAIEDPTWAGVWQRAATGAADGLDPDAALAIAAHRLANRLATDPVQPHQYVAAALATQLAEQHAEGRGWQPAVPWMTNPHRQGTMSDPLRDDLHRLESAIHARVAELGAQTTAAPPRWTAQLGSRPTDPVAAERWDRMATLAAAYRDTYEITSTSADAPLGPEPDGPSLRARAWHDLRAEWAPPDAAAEHSPACRANETETATDRLRGDLDPDEFQHHLAQTNPVTTRTDESFAVLLERHQRASHELLTHAAQHALSQHAPHTLGADAEPALLDVLRRADQDGWQLDRLVSTVAGQSNLGAADDPAALLTSRIQRHTTDHDPPAPAAEPSQAQIEAWHTIAATHAPQADVTTDDWHLVWRHAAAGAAEGLDVETAIANAAEQLHHHAAAEPIDEHRYVGQLVVDQLAEQRDSGEGTQPSVPWMLDPSPAAQVTAPELAADLAELHEIARSRLGELRETVADEQPAWTAGLGARPEEPAAAERWDEVAAVAAAYRETYNVGATNPDAPLGAEPAGHGARVESWHQITEQWRPVMTTPDDGDNQQRIDALRDELREPERADERVDERYDDDQHQSERSGFGLGH